MRELEASLGGQTLSLAGYSIGGTLALEMAAQLRAAGREVGPVFLLDAWIPRAPLRGLEKLAFRVGELLRFSPEDRRHWLRAQLARVPLLGMAPRERVEEGADLVDDERMTRLGEQGVQWTPPYFEGAVVLFRAMRHVRGYSEPPGPSGWERCCPALVSILLPCDHRAIVEEPHVVGLARQISALL